MAETLPTKFSKAACEEWVEYGLIKWADLKECEKPKGAYEFINDEAYEAVKAINFKYSKKQVKKEETDPGQIVMPFGNEWTKGKKLKDLSDKSLEWVMNSNGEQAIKDAAKKVLESRKGEKKAPETSTSLITIGDQAYPTSIRLAGKQEIVLQKKTFQLRASEGHIYYSGTKDGVKQYAIQADGYLMMNKFANLTIATPPTVMIDGVLQNNPYPIRTKDHRRLIELVVVRKIAIGRAPMGNIVAVDQTISFAPYTYFMESLLKLTEDYPTVAEIRTINSLTPEEKRNFPFYEIDESVGVFIHDKNNKEYLKALSNHISNQKFGERKAASICERNCMRKHPAFGIRNVQLKGKGSDAYAELPVFSWIETESTRNQILKYKQVIEQGSKDINDLNIEVSTHEDDLSTIDEAEIVEEHTEDDE